MIVLLDNVQILVISKKLVSKLHSVGFITSLWLGITQWITNEIKVIQVFAIEFVAFAIEFVSFAIEFVGIAIEFVPFAIEFVGFAVELVGFAIEFVAFALQFVINKTAPRNQPVH